MGGGVAAGVAVGLGAGVAVGVGATVGLGVAVAAGRGVAVAVGRTVLVGVAVARGRGVAVATGGVVATTVGATVAATVAVAVLETEVSGVCASGDICGAAALALALGKRCGLTNTNPTTPSDPRSSRARQSPMIQALRMLDAPPKPESSSHALGTGRRYGVRCGAC
jgi:hypothetical protein